MLTRIVLQAPILRNLNKYQWAITMIQHAADPALTTKSTDWYIWEVRKTLTHSFLKSSIY